MEIEWDKDETGIDYITVGFMTFLFFFVYKI